MESRGSGISRNHRYPIDRANHREFGQLSSRCSPLLPVDEQKKKKGGKDLLPFNPTESCSINKLYKRRLPRRGCREDEEAKKRGRRGRRRKKKRSKRGVRPLGVVPTEAI